MVCTLLGGGNQRRRGAASAVAARGLYRLVYASRIYSLTLLIFVQQINTISINIVFVFVEHSKNGIMNQENNIYLWTNVILTFYISINNISKKNYFNY